MRDATRRILAVLTDLLELLPYRRYRLCDTHVRQCFDCRERERYFTQARGGLTREQWQQHLADERAAAERHATEAAAALRPTS